MYTCQAFKFHTPGDVPISDATFNTPRTVSAATIVLPPSTLPPLSPLRLPPDFYRPMLDGYSRPH